MYLKSNEQGAAEWIAGGLHKSQGRWRTLTNLDTVLGWVPSNAAVVSDMADPDVTGSLTKMFGTPTHTVGEYNVWFIEDFEIKYAEKCGASIWKGKLRTEKFVLKDRTT